MFKVVVRRALALALLVCFYGVSPKRAFARGDGTFQGAFIDSKSIATSVLQEKYDHLGRVFDAMNEEGLSEGAVERCKEGFLILQHIGARHYREIQTKLEFILRLNQAGRNLFEHVELAQGINPDDAKVFFSQKLFAKFTEGVVSVECVFPEWVSQNLGIPAQEVWDGIIQAFLSEMDPHSFIVDAKQEGSVMELSEGARVGLGLEMKRYEGDIIVMKVWPGSPAQKAGIEVGDLIEEVRAEEGVFQSGELDAGLIRKLFMATAGKSVDLSVRRLTGQLEEIFLTQQRYEISSVGIRDVGGGIAHIRLDAFREGAAAEMEEKIRSFKNLKGIVLDLRQNFGGLVIEATRIADLFIDTGIVYMAYDRFGIPLGMDQWTANTPGRVTNVPMVVLVHDYTASASEILAQALRDYGRAFIVGRRTWGKGGVMVFYHLKNGRHLALTEGLYYSRDGESAQGVGVEVDFETADPDMERIFNRKVQLAEQGLPSFPMHETELHAHLDTPPPLPERVLFELGVDQNVNPIGSIFSWVKAGMVSMAHQVFDPALNVSHQVIEVLKRNCMTFQVTSCRVEGQDRSELWLGKL